MFWLILVIVGFGHNQSSTMVNVDKYQHHEQCVYAGEVAIGESSSIRLGGSKKLNYICVPAAINEETKNEK